MKKFIAPAVIFALLYVIGQWVLSNPPESQRRAAPTGPQTTVEISPIVLRDYQIRVSSYGTVTPRTQSTLVAQVRGQIEGIKDEFRAGGFFSAGDALLTIDPRDYEADVKIAEASLMDALQAQAQEQARSEQALSDWARLGDPGEQPSDLVLRKPQLQAAQARVSSSESALTKAKLDLERTRVTAPFNGRVLSQMVDVGQVVTVGTPLAEIYATDYVEIRLPLRNDDLAFVDLPEQQATQLPQVTLTSNLGGVMSWQGQVVRTEGAIDTIARQLHVVAQINDPFGSPENTANGASEPRRPLKIGEYMTATIDGRLLQDVIVIPSATIYQNTYVYIVEGGLLQRKNVDIAWQNGIEAIIASGLEPGAALVTTSLGQISSGTPVRVAGSESTASTEPSQNTAAGGGAS